MYYHYYIKQSLHGTQIQIIIQYLEKLYIWCDHRAYRGLGLDESEFTKSGICFIFFTLLGHYSKRE